MSGLIQKLNQLKDTSMQCVYSGFLELKRLKDNPDIVQKTVQIGIFTIRGWGDIIGKQLLQNFTPFLVSTNDGCFFWGFIRQPFFWLSRLTSTNILWENLNHRLQHEMISHLRQGTPGPVRGEAEVPAIATACLNARLAFMTDKSYNYKNGQEFKKDLLAQIKSLNNPAYANLNLSNLHIPFQKDSPLDWGTNISFTFVDILTVPFYLEIWGINPFSYLLEKTGELTKKASNLVGLGNQAAAFGQSRLAQWVSKPSLEDWVWGWCVVGFAFQLSQAIKSLYSTTLTEKERGNRRREAVTAAAEMLYSAANLVKCNNMVIYSLGIIAKASGIYKLAKWQGRKELEV